VRTTPGAAIALATIRAARMRIFMIFSIEKES
jgi:hypothetical protein